MPCIICTEEIDKPFPKWCACTDSICHNCACTLLISDSEHHYPAWPDDDDSDGEGSAYESEPEVHPRFELECPTCRNICQQPATFMALLPTLILEHQPILLTKLKADNAAFQKTQTLVMHALVHGVVLLPESPTIIQTICTLLAHTPSAQKILGAMNHKKTNTPSFTSVAGVANYGIDKTATPLHQLIANITMSETQPDLARYSLWLLCEVIQREPAQAQGIITRLSNEHVLQLIANIEKSDTQPNLASNSILLLCEVMQREAAQAQEIITTLSNEHVLQLIANITMSETQPKLVSHSLWLLCVVIQQQPAQAQGIITRLSNEHVLQLIANIQNSATPPNLASQSLWLLLQSNLPPEKRTLIC